MRYCLRCLMPSTKPYLSFDSQGICGACKAHEKKQKVLDGIDWSTQEKKFNAIVENAKSKKAPLFDAMVPVSGGKDSITQVHRLLKFGLRILAVNIDYGIKTEIGVDNLNCIPEMGANLIIYRPELSLHKRLILIGLEDFGDPDLLSHTLLHAGPLHIALKLQIPLIALGEDSSFEYSGAQNSAMGMTREWFSKYAANKGNDALHVSKAYNIPFEKLTMYDFPDEIETSNMTKTIFLSNYFFWDSETHLHIAQQYGFKSLEHAREGTYRTYVGIDEKINRIHQYLKVLKFGYGRATDHACEDIRNGRLSREKAKDLVREYDLEPLSDDYICSFSEFIGIQPGTCREILEASRNKEIWKKTKSGEWAIPGHLEDEL